MPRDVDATAHPHAIGPLDMVEKPLERHHAPGPADETAVQADRTACRCSRAVRNDGMRNFRAGASLNLDPEPQIVAVVMMSPPWRRDCARAPSTRRTP